MGHADTEETHSPHLHRRKVSLDTVDSDGEDKIVDETNIADLMKSIPQGSDKTGTIIDTLLDTLPDKWRNWVIRVIFTILMCGGFGLAMYYGPIPLIFLTLCVQVKCFQEIIAIGYSVYRVHGLPWFRSLSVYMLFTSNYFLFGERVIDVITIVFNKNYIEHFFKPLVTYHRFISFMLYVVGFVWFVLSLVKKYYLRQFSLFAWTHVTLLLVVSCSYLIILNMFEALIWFIISVSIIVINDCMAYVFGFFFGRTPLIKLSPKKTWEGFIGGAISTIFLGGLLSHVLAGSRFFTCPIESYIADEWDFVCTPSPVFQSTEYCVPEMLSVIGFPKTITTYPFVFHSLSLSLFGAIIGPFGGFFASGFKRAFRIKDFGDIIPGHGGIVDRFDCQYLMAVFVHVYISSFIALPNPERILKMIDQLKPEDQFRILQTLQNRLQSVMN